VSSHKKLKKSKKNYNYGNQKRTPRTLKVEERPNQNLPALIPESFNLNALKNIDFVGKIDDMRVLTKELSVMARQIEQWIGVAYTVAAAFKDDGILKEVVKSLSAIGSPEAKEQPKPQQRPRKSANQPAPFSFPFLGQQNYGDVEEDEPSDSKGAQGSQGNGPAGMNIFEVISNPAFQEIMSKLFLQNKK